MNNKKISIFGKGKEKILECLYRNRQRELYFSEILRDTSLTPNTTLKHLKVLEESDIITSKKKIANTFYKINPNNRQVYALFAYFDYKRLNSLSGTRKRAIIDFIDKLDKKPLISVIFGSTAKGTFTGESDIDILLIYDKKETQDTKLKKEIESLTGIHIQTFIIDYDYFKEQMIQNTMDSRVLDARERSVRDIKESDNMIIHAIKTGFVYSGHDLFYNEVLQ